MGIEMVVSDARPADMPAMAAIATATGQEDDWGGANPAYIGHLMRHGRVAVLAVSDGAIMAAGTAAGTAAGPAGDYGLMHLATSPAAGHEAAAAAVITALAGLEPPGTSTNVCLPAPHPAVRDLLAAGWRVQDFDLFMASEPGMLDPRRAVPSAGQA